MNQWVQRASIVLNLSLLFTLFFLNNKVGWQQQAIAADEASISINAAPHYSPSLSLSPLLSPTTLDHVLLSLWWKNEIRNQVRTTRNHEYTGCVFGDSISSGIGNNLGTHTFNFALSGMSTISLIEQLKVLNDANVKCKKAIIAIGTNDAAYDVPDDIFLQNMKESILRVKAMGASQVILLPAFYSTLAASHDPKKAGPIPKVEAINALIRQTAESEKLAIASEAIQPLFQGQTLKESLTNDGVHLNVRGKKIYRGALLKLLASSL